MAGTFKFELVTPERMALSQDATQVLVPGVEGEFTVLPGHAPVISALRPGVIEVTLAESGETERIFVKGGFAEVDADRVTVLAERALAVEQMSARCDHRRAGDGRGRARRCRRRRLPPRRRLRRRAAQGDGALGGRAKGAAGTPNARNLRRITGLAWCPLCWPRSGARV